MKINELRDGTRKVDLAGTVTEKAPTREVRSKTTNETFKVADIVLSDETGQVNLVLWNEQINQVRVDDKIQISNGYVKSFRDVLQLSVGKYGTLTVL